MSRGCGLRRCLGSEDTAERWLLEGQQQCSRMVWDREERKTQQNPALSCFWRWMAWTLHSHASGDGWLGTKTVTRFAGVGGALSQEPFATAIQSSFECEFTSSSDGVGLKIMPPESFISYMGAGMGVRAFKRRKLQNHCADASNPQRLKPPSRGSGSHEGQLKARAMAHLTPPVVTFRGTRDFRCR